MKAQVAAFEGNGTARSVHNAAGRDLVGSPDGNARDRLADRGRVVVRYPVAPTRRCCILACFAGRHALVRSVAEIPLHLVVPRDRRAGAHASA